MGKNGIGRTKTLWVSVWGLASGGVDNFPHIIAQMTDYVKALGDKADLFIFEGAYEKVISGSACVYLKLMINRDEPLSIFYKMFGQNRDNMFDFRILYGVPSDVEVNGAWTSRISVPTMDLVHKLVDEREKRRRATIEAQVRALRQTN
jgi:hypothetical protein